MNLIFEEEGDIRVATVLESLGAAEPTSYQVELLSGRRVKVKSAHVLLKFAQPDAANTWREAQQLQSGFDLDFLWQVAPQEEFEVSTLAQDYFGAAPSPAQWLALLLVLLEAPIYFRRKGRGRFKPASETELKAALAGLEKRRLQAEQQNQFVEQLQRGELPPGWLERAPWLLFKPDKNSVEYKALEQASKVAQLPPLKLLQQAGAFPNNKELHRQAFLVEWFPRGTVFETVETPAAPTQLPRATVPAFSIDDSFTTEIDDAFSVQLVDENLVRVGIHIAAPGLGIAPDSALDVIARKRLSTVYLPGEKITMLPAHAVEIFTLAQGRECPVLSLYADFDLSTRKCLKHETRVEKIFIAANLRYEKLDALINETTLNDTTTEIPFKRELKVLWDLALEQLAQREAMRGKPELRNRTDFSVRIEVQENGEERVRLEPRQRDALLDRLVAEWMIFVNSTWAKALAEAQIPAIYRTQTHWAQPGSKQSAVKMSSVPAAHIGIGVSHYMWSSSPLRRYVDLLNQWQLLAWVQQRKPAFEKNSSELFSIMGAFDAAYGAYGDVETALEKYWSLRWLQQQGYVGTGKILEATQLRNEYVRLNQAPLAAALSGTGHIAPGTLLKVTVSAVDEIELTLSLRLVEVVAPEISLLQTPSADQ